MHEFAGVPDINSSCEASQESSYHLSQTEFHSPENPEPYFPDGGPRAWTQVLVGFLLMFSSWGLINAFGVFQTYYSIRPALGTPSSIAWIGSLQSFLVLLLGAFSGRLVDAGYARSMTTVGSFLIVFGLVCTSLSGGSSAISPGKVHLVYYQIFLSQGVCCGIGMGLVFMPSVSITTTYFQNLRALAVGIVTTGAAIGGIFYPIMFEALLAKLDFRWAVRAIALIALLTLAIPCILIRPRTDLPKKNAPILEFGAFRERSYTMLVIGMFGSFVGVYVVYFYTQDRILAAGVDLRGLKPQYLISFLNVGGAFGRIVPNYIADKSQPIVIHSICVCLGGVLIFVWPFVLTLPGNVAFCLIYGFLSGAFISLPPSSIASTTLEMSRFGARLGIAVTCNGFGLLMGPPIAGALISRGSGNGYWHASIFSGLAVVLGGILLGIAGKFKSGSNRNAPVRNSGS